MISDLSIWNFLQNKKQLIYHLYLLYTTLQLFHKKISYRTFWCIMNLTQNITKESDPVRQKHYTTKKHWLVDFINIFWFILKLFRYCSRVSWTWENRWCRLITVKAIGFLYPNILDTLSYIFAGSSRRIKTSMLMHWQR